MDLIVNNLAATASSLGVHRFYQGVMRHLAWPDRIELTRLPRGAIGRARELFERGRQNAIFWSPAHRGPLWVRHHVLTLHDCINVEFKYAHDWRLPLFRELFNRVLDNAERVVISSNATRESALRNYRIDIRKIVVIPLAFDPPSPEIESFNEVAGEPFVLLVANALAHKNTVRACEAFVRSSAIREGVRLKIVGTVAEEARKLVARTPLIEINARVEDAALRRLYRSCLFLFSPSLSEGYNLPIAEAIACGANVLCSDIPVHREFFARHVEWCDPHLVDSMAAALDTAFLRSKDPWHPDTSAIGLRTSKDVADDYRRVFAEIA